MGSNSFLSCCVARMRITTKIERETVAARIIASYVTRATSYIYSTPYGSHTSFINTCANIVRVNIVRSLAFSWLINDLMSADDSTKYNNVNKLN